MEANGDNEKKLKNTNSQRDREAKDPNPQRSRDLMRRAVERRAGKRDKPTKERPDSSAMSKEMAKKYMKVRGNNRSSIDDFIAADDPFDVKAQKDAQRDIEDTGGTDTRPNFTRQDTFQKSGKFKKPVSGTPKAKGFKPKATGKNIKGEQGIKLNPFSGTINPKTGKVEEPPLKIIQKGSTARKQAQRAPATPKKSTAQKLSDKKSTDEFQKDLAATGETMGSEGMKSDAEKIIKRQGKKAGRDVEGGGKKTGSLSKGDLKFSGDKAYRQLRRSQINRDMNYQQRMQQAFDTGSGAPRFTNIPDAQPLPAGKGKPKGEPQKPRPRAQRPPEGAYSRVGGQREVVGKVDNRVTGGEYGKLRSGQTADQSAFVQAQTGRDLEGNPLSKDQRIKLMRRSRGLDSDAVTNVSKNLTKGGMPRSELDKSGGFERGRQGTLTRRGSDPRNEKSPNVETMPQQIGRKFKDMADKTQTAQQSFLGALGGFVTKGVSSSAAGAEAGMRYARGDKTGAALSALQGLGGGVGFAAGVANAIKSMRIAKGGKTAGLAKVVPPEDLAMAAATGGAVIPQIKGALSKLPKGVPGVQGGRVGRRSAPS